MKDKITFVVSILAVVLCCSMLLMVMGVVKDRDNKDDTTVPTGTVTVTDDSQNTDWSDTQGSSEVPEDPAEFVIKAGTYRFVNDFEGFNGVEKDVEGSIVFEIDGSFQEKIVFKSDGQVVAYDMYTSEETLMFTPIDDWLITQIDVANDVIVSEDFYNCFTACTEAVA